MGFGGHGPRGGKETGGGAYGGRHESEGRKKEKPVVEEPAPIINPELPQYSTGYSHKTMRRKSDKTKRRRGTILTGARGTILGGSGSTSQTLLGGS